MVMMITVFHSILCNSVLKAVKVNSRKKNRDDVAGKDLLSGAVQVNTTAALVSCISCRQKLTVAILLMLCDLTTLFNLSSHFFTVVVSSLFAAMQIVIVVGLTKVKCDYPTRYVTNIFPFGKRFCKYLSFLSLLSKLRRV